MAKRKNSLISDFSAFIKRGNVIDLAVGVIIGGAFTPIVTSLTKDIIMPPIGLLLGDGYGELRLGIGKSYEVISESGEKILTYPAYINYGNFIQVIVNFLIIALVIFILVKIVASLKRKLEATREKLSKHEEIQKEVVEPTPTPIPEDIVLLTEIRDLLKKEKTYEE